MSTRMRITRHEAVPESGSYEVRFPDGRPSRYFYFDDLPSRRLRPETLTSDEAKRTAQALARTEQAKLDSTPFGGDIYRPDESV